MGVSEWLIGLTIVAVGTSLPELAARVRRRLPGRVRHRARQHRRIEPLQHPVHPWRRPRAVKPHDRESDVGDLPARSRSWSPSPCSCCSWRSSNGMRIQRWEAATVAPRATPVCVTWQVTGGAVIAAASAPAGVVVEVARAPMIHSTPLTGISNDTPTNASCRLDRSATNPMIERRDRVAQRVDDQDVDRERGRPDVGPRHVRQDRVRRAGVEEQEEHGHEEQHPRERERHVEHRHEEREARRSCPSRRRGSTLPSRRGCAGSRRGFRRAASRPARRSPRCPPRYRPMSPLVSDPSAGALS